MKSLSLKGFRSLKNIIRQIVSVIIRKTMKICPKIFRLVNEEIAKELHFNHNTTSTKSVLMRLREQEGFRPKSIIDCGAYEGHWTQMIRDIYPEANVLMIEANPEKEKCLKEVASKYPGYIKYSIALLGKRNKQKVKFYKLETGSSVYEEQTNVPREEIYLKMQQMEDVAKASGSFTKPDLIKLDVQGSELDILKGSVNYFQKAQLLLLEVSFLHYNKGAPLFNEVVNFMATHNFYVYDVGDLMRWGPNSVLFQCDLFFIKSDSFLRCTFGKEGH